MRGSGQSWHVKDPPAQVAGVEGNQEAEAGDSDQAAQPLPFPGDRQAEEQGGDTQRPEAVRRR